MASITISIDTVATGPLSLTNEITEVGAQKIFAALLGLSSNITDQREIPDPNDSKKTIIENYERTRTLGEALKDRVNIFLNGLNEDVKKYEEQKAVEDAKKKLDGTGISFTTKE